MVSSIYRSESLKFYEFQKERGKIVSFPFSQRPPGTHLYLTWVGFIDLLPYWLIGHLDKVSEMTCFRICLGEALRKWGFTLHQILSRSEVILWLAILILLTWKGEEWSELKFWLIVKQQTLILARIGGYLVYFCSGDNILFVYVHTIAQLSCFWLDLSQSQNGLILVLCKIVDVQ